MSTLRVLDKKNIEDIVGLTPIQEGMLFHYLNEPKSEMYFEQMSFKLTGELDLELFKKAWNSVSETNEMLRTVFRWDKVEKPIQVILKKHEIPILEYDFSSEGCGISDEILARIRQEDREKKIDIGSSPVRITLCKLSPAQYEMILSSYHIIIDGWSNGIILKEFLKAYGILAAGGQPTPQLKNKYKEFVKWLFKRDKEKQRLYWEKYLDGFTSKTLLPYDRTKQEGNSKADDYIESLSDKLTGKVNDFCRRYNVTSATVFNYTWGLLLQKYNDINDVLFGLTVSGRTPEINGVEDIVGLFINTIPVRVKTEPKAKIIDLLKKTERELRECQEYESTSLAEIKPLCKVDLSNRENLFDSIVVIENYPLDIHVTEDSPINIRLDHIFEMTNFDITVVISVFDNIGLRIIYDTNIFNTATIKRLVKQYSFMLEQIVETPEQSADQIEILNPEEKKQVIYDFNKTELDYPKLKTIHEIIEEQAEKTPDNQAVVFENQTITYRELNKKSNKLARFLRKKGVMAETIVGLMMERSIDMIVGLVAILKAGGAYLPIDISLPEDRILYMLKDADAKLVLTNSRSIKNIPFTKLQGFEENSGTGIIVTNPRGHIKEFDSLPMPDRTLINMKKYKNKIGMASVNNCISLQTTRGCPYKCLYCHKIWSKNHVHRSAENIFNEINYYYKNGVRNFAVIDDCFNLDMENSSRLFRLIIENRLKIQLFFPNGLRGDILTPDYIDLMVEAGTRGINLSLETASPRLQKLLKKNLDLDRFKNVINYIVTKHPEIILEMATMHGFPTETEEEAMMTLNFIKDIKWLHFPYVHILKIFPNTEMEAFALEYGISKEDILRSRNRAFHELPETLPFPKTFTRKYQANFMNEYFLSKERLKKVLPVQLKILDKDALVQKYNAYLPTEIKSIQDLLNFTEIYDLEISEDQEGIKEVPAIFNRDTNFEKTPDGAKKILFLDLSQNFSSEGMLYKVAEQPIGHIYLLTYLKKVFGERIDGRIYKSGNDFDSFDELKTLVGEYKPDMIGIRTLTFFKEFFHKTVSLLRQWGVDVPIITGGPYASSDYDTILKDKNVSLVLFGEGEYTLTELVERMLENQFRLPGAEVLRTINGIAFDESNIKTSLCSNREVILIDEMSVCLDEENGENPDPVTNGENLAYVMYTSGTTGRPKGVMVEHRQVNNCIFWMQKEFNLNGNDVIVQRTNLTFDPSVWELFWPLYIGGKVKLITAEQGKNAEYLIDLMTKDSSITMMYCPASLITGMLYLLNSKENKPKLSMPWLLIGAEPISADTINSFYKYFEGRIVNTYGPTECTINNTFFHINRNNDLNVVPIGKPVANNKIYILSKDLKPVPIGVPGEIYISGASTARGYVNNIEKTRQSFIRSPFSNEIMYRTGDLGKWLENGNIQIMGRNDEQVKIRGYRIELGEIESAILKHSSVRECVVALKESKKPEKIEQKCTQCGITSFYQGVTIDADGKCNICQDIDTYKRYADKYFKNLNDLDNILGKNREKRKSKYDCLVVYNGGRGTAYAIYRLIEMGYSVLTLTYDNGYFSKAELNNIKEITRKMGVDNIILTHSNSDKILLESCKIAGTVCRGCFHTSGSLAAEYAFRNNIDFVIGATLSRGQIIENKLSLFFRKDIFDVKEIEQELKKIQKTTPLIDKQIFELIDIGAVNDGTVYETVKFLDFYRYCDITNEEMLEYLNNKDEYWKSRKNYAIYSTNCPIKQIGDYCHIKEKGFHYYGSATSWERRLGHISLEDLKEDIKLRISENAFSNFARKIGYKPESDEKIEMKFLCAYIVADDEVEVSDLKHFIAKDLPDYMIPSHIIEVDNIPLTSNGKIDKKALPEPDVMSVKTDYVAPANEVEDSLAKVWKKILGVDKVGRHDNFFDLGGNSILLIQMHSQVDKLYPGKITLTELFAYTTISQISEFIQQADESKQNDINIEGIPVPADFIIDELHGNPWQTGSTFNFILDENRYGKLKHIAESDNVETDDIIHSVYIYLLSVNAANKYITVQTMFNDDGCIYPSRIDLNSMNNFTELYKALNTQSKNKLDGYKVSQLKNLHVAKDSNSVIPFIYRKSSAGINIRFTDIYDLVPETKVQSCSYGILLYLVFVQSMSITINNLIQSRNTPVN
ncbi:MAG TPA: amino acid adenylation domain-containing protein [Ruminiclostridium sp.]|nr:amino acid adenylation domain-containing protein [Ruminiclostridium sp.]